jgi:hypothetical protein
MAIGEKLYETRSWGTSYRGFVAIQAAKTKKGDQLRETPVFAAALGDRELPHGAVVAVGLLSVVRPAGAVRAQLEQYKRGKELAFGDYSDGRFAWLFSEMFRLTTPFPLRAYQGLFEAPPQLRAAIHADWPQLGLDAA